MYNYERMETSIKMRKLFEWNKWIKLIPNIKFKEKWEIKIIPPFGGAIIRFLVYDGKNQVSVYLDCYDELGCYGEPYWEIYPYNEDVCRYKMNDIESLLKGIEESFDQRKEGMNYENSY